MPSEEGRKRRCIRSIDERAPCVQQPHLCANSEWKDSDLGDSDHKAHWNFIGGWWEREEVETW